MVSWVDMEDDTFDLDPWWLAVNEKCFPFTVFTHLDTTVVAT